MVVSRVYLLLAHEQKKACFIATLLTYISSTRHASHIPTIPPDRSLDALLNIDVIAVILAELVTVEYRVF